MLPSPIIALIFAAIDDNKNAQKTFLGEFGNSSALVSLVTMIACIVVTLVIYIIPLIISLFFELAKIVGLVAFISWGVSQIIALLPF